MDFLNDIYQQSLEANDKNLSFWKKYLKSLQSLDFNVFADKLKVPTLVPVGNRILFRGELKHTNEITIAMGADYFVKCSLKQGEVLRKHRMKDAQSKINSLKKEKKYLENQLSLSFQTFEDEGKEIIEVFTEDEDLAWREKHKENVKQYYLKKREDKKVNDETAPEMTDEDLWYRLEELELQEELEEEYLSTKEDSESFVETSLDDEIHNFETEHKFIDIEEEKNEKDVNEILDSNSTKQSPKTNLLKKAIEKQNELAEKLFEIKNKERCPSKTESDLIWRLNQLEDLEDVEDEMDRLDDILESKDSDDANDTEESTSSSSSQAKLKRGIYFADDDNSETLEISFSHTDVEPCGDTFNPEIGISKPSDIYKAYPHLFGSKPTSILKKSKYEDKVSHISVEPPIIEKKLIKFEEIDKDTNRTVVVKDVVEHTDKNSNHLLSRARPTSLFKKRRQQSNIT